MSDNPIPLPTRSSRRRSWRIAVVTMALSWISIFLIILTGQVAGGGMIATAMIGLIVTSIAAWVGQGAWDYRIYLQLMSLRAASLMQQAFPVAPVPGLPSIPGLPGVPVVPGAAAAEQELPPAGPGMADDREASA